MIKRWVTLGLLVALSAIGAFVKVGPWSIAFDATAGFTAALILGPADGALVCCLGHLAAASATGYPLTPLFHLAIAVTMAGVGAAGGLAARRFGRMAGAVALVLANGLLAPALLSLIPNPLGTGLFVALAGPLTLGAAANAAVALAVAGALKRTGVVA